MHLLLASALMVFFGILWRFALKRCSRARSLAGTYFLLHGYPIASTCSAASLETVNRMSDLFVERMAKSKAQGRTDHRRMGQLIPANSRSRSCSPRAYKMAMKRFLRFWANKRDLLQIGASASFAYALHSTCTVIGMNSPLPFVPRGAKARGMARHHSPRHPLFRQR